MDTLVSALQNVKYEDATNKQKEAYSFFARRLMPCSSRKWKEELETGLPDPMVDCSTPTEAAIVLMYFDVYLKDFLPKEEDQESQKTPAKKAKMSGGSNDNPSNKSKGGRRNRKERERDRERFNSLRRALKVVWEKDKKGCILLDAWDKGFRDSLPPPDDGSAGEGDAPKTEKKVPEVRFETDYDIEEMKKDAGL